MLASFQRVLQFLKYRWIGRALVGLAALGAALTIYAVVVEPLRLMLNRQALTISKGPRALVSAKPDSARRSIS